MSCDATHVDNCVLNLLTLPSKFKTGRGGQLPLALDGLDKQAALQMMILEAWFLAACSELVPSIAGTAACWSSTNLE